MKIKTITIILTILTILFIIMPNSNAALQSNGSAGTTQIIGNWIVNIRKMEALGGGMGLTETIKSDLTPSTASNNVDVHMEKNTEYGAMAILSASSYGNPNKIASGGTTTGNKTGIVINLNAEWVAAGTISDLNVYVNANKKYKDSYTMDYSPKRGDAISETAGWHGSGASQWIYSTVTYADRVTGILRAHSGSIFSYYGKNDGPGSSKSAYYEAKNYSRAAMICGEGV